MHPAPSIIVFTTLSGIGFGLMAWLGLGIGPDGFWFAFTACGLALGFACVGLVASLWHLGNPQRPPGALGIAPMPPRLDHPAPRPAAPPAPPAQRQPHPVRPAPQLSPCSHPAAALLSHPPPHDPITCLRSVQPSR